MKILVINGHKYYWYSTGRLNRVLFEHIVNTLCNTHDVMTTIVEQGYRVEQEIEKYVWADAIIYQNPLNWFSVPWILKKYFDEVFKNGIFFKNNEKYGEGGLLNGKKYMFSLTCASAESEFSKSKGFYDLRSIDDIYISEHKMHEFCGMEKIDTFCAYNVMKDPQTERNKDKLKFHLNKYFK